MTRRLRTVASLLALTATTTAASSADQFDVRYLLATLGLATMFVSARYIWGRDRGLVQFEGDVSVALWGPRDANGRRDVEVGVVAQVHRMASDLPRAIVAAEAAAKSAREAAEAALECAGYAATAASAAKTAQSLLLERQNGGPT